MKKTFKETFVGRLLSNKIAPSTEFILNTALSVVEEKTRDADMSFVKDKTKKGKIFSHKRLLNLTGTGAIIITALSQIIENGIDKLNLILVGIGVAYSLGMAFITVYKEK